MTLGDRIKLLIHGGEHFLLTFAKQEIKVPLASPLGVGLTTALHAGDALPATATAGEKMGAAVDSFMPSLIQYVTGAEPFAAKTDLETVAKDMLEDALAQVKQTGPLAIFEAVLHAFA